MFANFSRPLESTRFQSVAAVVGLTFLFYLAFTAAALGLHQNDPLWFVWIGDRYQELDPAGSVGYDGQFVYYLADEGLAAAPHLDNAPYRMQRILLPALVGLLAWGSAEWIPWVLILVNLAAIVGATTILARWLKREHLSPWYALLHGLTVGTLMAFSRDLTEPLALFLTIAGIAAWLDRRVAWAVFLLALAILTKETMMLFVLGIGLAELLQRQVKPAVAIGLSLVPFALWELFLFQRFGTFPLLSGPSLEGIPLVGILPHLTTEPGRVSALVLVALPALLLLPVALVIVYRQRGRSPSGWWLLLHVVFVLLLPLNVYDHIMHTGRNAAGLIVACLFLLPSLARPLRLLLLGYWVAPTAIWLIPILRWAPWR